MARLLNTVLPLLMSNKESTDKLWKESTLQSLKAVEEAGVQIVYPNKDSFIEKVQPMLEEFKEEKAVYDLIQKIKNVK